MLCRLCLRLLGAVVLVFTLHPASAAVPFDPALPQIPREVALPRWDEARIALDAEGVRLDRCLRSASACAAPRLRAWRTLVAELRGAPAATQLRRVNSFVNTVPYVADIDRYGRSDFWAGPWQFLQGQGDCEDYALAKYATLRRLGFEVDNLRILVVEDTWRGLAHAVLAVRLGKEIWLLDNQHEEPIAAAAQRRYSPYYAVNEESRWLHRLPTRTSSGGG